jgi:hypothetical protein
MKTVEEVQAFVNEVRAVCLKHGLVLIGTCENEGIYGEITILENTFPEPQAWRAANEQLSDEPYLIYGTYTISGIGDVLFRLGESK